MGDNRLRMWETAWCRECGVEAGDRHKDECDVSGVWVDIYRDPSPADLLIDPRVLALVEALRDARRHLVEHDNEYHHVTPADTLTACDMALAPFSHETKS